MEIAVRVCVTSGEPWDVWCGRDWNGLKNQGWGNPYPMHGQTLAERERVIELFRRHLLACPELMDRARQELAGKRLACVCQPYQPCHVDLLVKVANGGEL